jgi:hypothetical protein
VLQRKSQKSQNLQHPNPKISTLIIRLLWLFWKGVRKTRKMSTISVTVEQPNQAFMLVEWLKNIRFVQDVTIDINKTANGNVEAVQKALDAIHSKHLFSDITDPVDYQKRIRDEWS